MLFNDEKKSCTIILLEIFIKHTRDVGSTHQTKPIHALRFGVRERSSTGGMVHTLRINEDKDTTAAGKSGEGTPVGREGQGWASRRQPSGDTRHRQ